MLFMRRYGTAVVLICLLVLTVAGCAATPSTESHAQRDLVIAVEPWPEANLLFKKDARWLGGDGASSVDLGNERVLWLFGDSFIGRGESRNRDDAFIVRNSIALQQGYDPSSATIDFYWDERGEEPRSFFPGSGNRWVWPGSGIRIGDMVLLFFMEIEESGGEFGFEPRGWKAALIDNPDDEPSRWSTGWLEAPQNDFNVIVGSGGALKMGDYLYVFGTDSKRYDVYPLRWNLASAMGGDLSDPQWWVAESRAWISQAELEGPPSPAFPEGQVECTVHYEPSLRLFLQIQTGALYEPDMLCRWAPSVTGPWTEPKPFHRPREFYTPGLLIYAGKAHPALAGGEVVLTYNVNSLESAQVLRDQDIYYPLFLRGRIVPQ